MAAKPKHVLSEADLAAIAGVSESTWKSHKAQGCPVPRSRKDLIPWLKRYHPWRRLHGKTELEESPKRRLEAVRAEREQLELDRERGRLVSRDDVEQLGQDLAFAVRQLLLAHPKKMASRFGPLCGLNGEAIVEEEETRAVHGILDALARGLPLVEGGSAPAVRTAARADGQPVG